MEPVEEVSGEQGLPVVNGVTPSEFPQDPDLSSFFNPTDVPKTMGDLPGMKKAPNFGRLIFWSLILCLGAFTINDIFTAWLVHFFK